MATTTKSKATRTSKKPAPAAKKTTKATKAAKAPAKAVKTTKSAAVKTAKTTKNTTVKASEKVAAPVKAEKPVITPLDRIKSVHVSIVAAYAIFAGLVAFAVSTAAVGVTLALQSKNEFASVDATVLGSANEVLFNVEPRYLLIASLLASVIASLLFATKLRNRYEATLANSTSGLRWVATGVSAGLLLTYVNLLVGITDLATLLLSAGFIFATSVFAFAAERDNVGAARPRLFAYSASLFTGAAAWLPAVGALIGTWVYGKEHYGWHVYAIAAVTFLGFSSLALAQRKQLRAAGTYVAAEARYLNIDLLTKFAVVIISLIALK